MSASIDICKMLTTEATLFFSKRKNGDITTYYSQRKELPFDQIYVIINNHTMSASELIAAALQDSGNIVIGQKSFGKGVFQSYYAYPGGIITLTSGEFFRKDGIPLNGLGVTPNICSVISNDTVYVDVLNIIRQKKEGIAHEQVIRTGNIT